MHCHDVVLNWAVTNSNLFQTLSPLLLSAAHPHHIYQFSIIILSVACMHHFYYLYAEYPDLLACDTITEPVSTIISQEHGGLIFNPWRWRHYVSVGPEETPTQCPIPEDDTQQQHCGNLRSCVFYPDSQFWQRILLSCHYSRCLSYLRSIINCHLLCVEFFVLDVLSSGSCHSLQHSFFLIIFSCNR
jgi:hypothetical protein